MPQRVPPGPRGYPILGAFLQARRDPLRWLMACARRYGDVVSMRLGTHLAFLLSHPDHVRRVLQDHADVYTKGATARRVQPLFGGSLTTADGDRWRLRRQQVSHAFQTGQHVLLVARACAEMLDRWAPRVERGEAIDVAREMRALTQRIILEALCGDVPGPEVRAIGDALDVAVGHVERRLWSVSGWLDVPTPARVRCRRALGAIDAFVARRVRSARSAGPSADTLLGALAQELDDGELHDEVKALMVAGHTTTAAALTWTWLEVSTHLGIQRRLEEEARDVLGGGFPRPGDLPRLGYTRRVIQEVLRLCPPTWLTARTPVADDEIAGYRLPAGALILLSPYVTHRHPAAWEAPERFDPDRFLPERSASRPAFAYFPFGVGPRRCVGSGFAVAEMLCVVASVASRYRLLIPEEHMATGRGLTLGPLSPVAAWPVPVPSTSLARAGSRPGTS